MPVTKYYAKKYIRLSHSDEKGTESDSVGNQRRLLDAFLAANPDIADMGEKVDDGYSGIIFDRPAFKELMEEIRAGKINCVIVKDLSRLGREYIETGRYLRRVFPAYGVRFIALGDGIDTAKGSAGDDTIISFKSVVNDAYCRDISTKTRSALAAKRENGDFVGAYTVYGYRKSPDNKNRLVIDEYPAGIVREIYRMRIAGMSAARIAEELNGQGVLSPLEYKKAQGLPHASGGYADRPDAKWSAHTVIRILGDETYTGALVQGRRGTPNYKVRDIQERPREEWVRRENAHAAIISRNDFALVRQLARLDTRTAPGGKQAPLFSGLLICGCCGGRMTRKTNTCGGKRYHYYYCPTKKKNGCDKPVMLREEALCACVLESIRAHVASLVSAEELLSAAAAAQGESTIAAQYRARIAEARRQMEQAHRYRAGLNELLMDGSLTKQEYTGLKARYTQDIQRLQSSIHTLEAELEDLESGGSERQRWLERLRRLGTSTELDRETVATLIHSIRVVGKRELDISFNYRPEFGIAAPTALESGVA